MTYRSSFRARLTAWNVIVLGISMVAVVAVIHMRLRSQELATIDQELKIRSTAFVKYAEHHMFNARNKFEANAQQSISRDYPSSDPSLRNGYGPDGLPVDKETEHIRWFRRPRFIDINGLLVKNLESEAAWDSTQSNGRIQEQPRFSYAHFQGESIRVLTTPVFQRGMRVGSVQMASPLVEFEQRWKQRALEAAFLLVLALLGAAFGGFLLASRALRPVSDVTHAAARIGEGDLSQRLTALGTDELGQLASTFNQMIAKLESAFQARDQAYHRLNVAYEKQKQFAADASHELRTPLTRIKTATSRALTSERTEEQLREALQLADRGIDSMSGLVSQLLMLARSDSGQNPAQFKSVDLVDLLPEITSMIDRQNLSCPVPNCPILILGDEALLECLFRNLLDNAIAYSRNSDPIRVSVSVEGTNAIVIVSDSGKGIDEMHLPYVFDRFYRADTSRETHPDGNGLGLAICKSIVESHNGDIELFSRVGKGTVAIIRFPLFPVPKSAE